MINQTALQHPTVILKVLHAMRESQKRGYHAYVTNKTGKNYLRVSYNPKLSGWVVIDSTGQNIVSSVNKAIYKMGLKKKLKGVMAIAQRVLYPYEINQLAV